MSSEYLLSVAVPTDVNTFSFSAHFAWDLAACTSFSLSSSCTGPAPRNLLCRQIADLPFQAVGRESAESPQTVALESPRSKQASAWSGPPTICNCGKDQIIVRQNPTLVFAEPYQGPMLSAVLDDNNPKDGNDTSSDDASRDPLEDLELTEAPEYLHKQIRDMLKTPLSPWDGTLGVISATEHAIVTSPDALPIRAQPYRTGPFKRKIIADQINKMLKLNVIVPSHSAWASPVEIVPKKNDKARFMSTIAG